MLCCIAVLPAIAQVDSGFRLQRSANTATGDDWSTEFQTAPPVVDPGVAGFTLDINTVQTRPSAPQMTPSFASLGQQAMTSFAKQLGPRELNLLSSRDVVILIDKSGSMGDRDCPAPARGLRFLPRIGLTDEAISRWEWCENELITMSQMASGALRQGIRVVLFASDQSVYDKVRFSEIPRIFKSTWPAGSTNAAPALRTQLEAYFANRVAGRSRPVVIAVITDGLPNNTRAVKKAIIDATASMQRPDEIAITFLQVGADRKGINLVHELDDDLVRQGAVFDIVDCKDFSDLLNVGLGRALADAINETGRVAGNTRRF